MARRAFLRTLFTPNLYYLGDLASNELTCYDVLEDSKNGIEQVIHCFIHGTNDLKALLLQYTDLVFECRNCRRLFRSLPNFVRHKEVSWKKWCYHISAPHKKNEYEI